MPAIDWSWVAYHALVSRYVDDVEETRLVPERKVVYQFSARGHEVAQILLASQLTHLKDGIGAYYRSRPLMMALGIPLDEIIASPIMKAGGYSDGRDVGVVCNYPNDNGPTVLPLAGDVGSQYTPGAGWAQSISYYRNTLGNKAYEGAIAVVTGGDGSVATNGFWSSLTIATTQRLPMLFVVEDNGFGISVPGSFQTPGGNIARNLRSFENLIVLDGDGTDPEETLQLVTRAVEDVRLGSGPVLLRLTVPRLSGHSGQDKQAYKGSALVEAERATDPITKLEAFLVPDILSADTWQALKEKAVADVEASLERVLSRPDPDPATVTRHTFLEYKEDGSADLQQAGGAVNASITWPITTNKPEPESGRENMIGAIRRAMQSELEINPNMLVFGEDVGPKGGVHTATLGLQTAFGKERVFDTSLSEEGIIGRAVGMALAGLSPVAEIQFRKYADPAMEQLNNCGTIRWRTANRFAAPIVVRMPGGFAKIGDPWHSVCNEVMFAHATGWEMIFPSNAEDAVGLLRAAMRSHNPTIFFEHRALLDAPSARRPYPGDQFMLPIGKANTVIAGTDLTVVTWGAMVDRCVKAAEASGYSVEVIDLRTIMPWDREAVYASVQKNNRCLIVHEDALTAGFGAEISASIAKDMFYSLDAPIERLAVPDIPIPHNPLLMAAMLPGVEEIKAKMLEVLQD
ncbi:MAG: transketolase C-terminal domain-containing protein [Rhodothermales bacterium]